MAAVVRVKRQRNENPVDSFVISCKRQKRNTGEDEHEESHSVHLKGHFKFAGTIENKAENVSHCVREAVRRKKLYKELKQHSSVPEVISKARRNQKLQAVSNRFKVVSQRRAETFDELGKEGIDEADLSKTSTTDTIIKESSSNECGAAQSDHSTGPYHFCDIVQDDQALSDHEVDTDKRAELQQDAPTNSEVITCNNVPMIVEKVQPKPESDSSYVYDIYYLNQSDFDFRALENILTIEAMRENEIYEYDREREEEIYDDEDDENDEDNWRNDYPDEDPHFYASDDNHDYEYEGLGGGGFAYDNDDLGSADMLRDRLTMTDAFTNELSSDDEDNVYFNEPLNVSNVWTPATSYEKYKKRVMKELDEDEDT